MGNIIVGLIVLLIVAWAVWKIYSDKKAGKTCSSCGGACSGGCCGTGVPRRRKAKRS